MYSVWSRLYSSFCWSHVTSDVTFSSATFDLKGIEYVQDVVDPVTDEMLAKFVVDSHFRSQAKGATLDEKSFTDSRDDARGAMAPTDPEVVLIARFLTICLNIMGFLKPV